jgi:hypothetical protein
MKLLSKLSTLIQSVARGSTGERPERPADGPAVDPLDAEPAPPAHAARDLEDNRVADLLQQKFASSKTSQQSQKGD